MTMLPIRGGMSEFRGCDFRLSESSLFSIFFLHIYTCFYMKNFVLEKNSCKEEVSTEI